MFIVFGKVFAIFIMIFIGFLANKIKILSNEAIPHITNLMLYVTAPCMAISSIYSKSISADVIVATVQTMAGAVIFFTVTTPVSYTHLISIILFGGSLQLFIPGHAVLHISADGLLYAHKALKVRLFTEAENGRLCHADFFSQLL